MTPTQDPGLVVVPPGHGVPVIRLNGEETELTAGDRETAGAYAVRLNSAPPRFAKVPMHIHREAEEAFLCSTASSRSMRATARGLRRLVRADPARAAASIANAGEDRSLDDHDLAASAGWVEAEAQLILSRTAACARGPGRGPRALRARDGGSAAGALTLSTSDLRPGAPAR